MRKQILALFLLFLLVPTVSLAWTVTSRWNQEAEGGWSCVDRTGGGVFTGSHHTIDSSSGTPDASNALKITYPVGWPMTSEATHCWNTFPSDVTEVWIQYYIKISSNWQWDAGMKHIFIQQRNSGTGNVFISTGGSGRLYMKTQTDAGTFNYASNKILSTNKWYKIVARFVMNTPGSANGIIQIWVDNDPVLSDSTVPYTNSTGNKFFEMTITPTRGGGGTLGVQDSLWFDYPIISTSKIEGGSIPPDTTEPPQTPEPPSNLSIQ